MLGRNMLIAITVIGLTMWPSNAKVARAQILSLKQREFVQASRVLGMGNSRILVLHIIPNIISPVLANSALQMGYAILIEAMLAFVGLGDLNVATWGQLIYSGQSSLTSAPWITFFPGVFIICFVVFCNLVGEGISKLRVKI
jgi:peptide/nickel transport system permease protein